MFLPVLGFPPTGTVIRRSQLSSKTIIDVCDVIRCEIETKDLSKYVNSILTAYVVKTPPDCEAGLALLLRLRGMCHLLSLFKTHTHPFILKIFTQTWSKMLSSISFSWWMPTNCSIPHSECMTSRWSFWLRNMRKRFGLRSRSRAVCLTLVYRTRGNIFPSFVN